MSAYTSLTPRVDPALRIVVLLGWLPSESTKSDIGSRDTLSGSIPAIVTIQKSHFSSGENLATLLSNVERVEVLEHNDVVSKRRLV